MADAAAYKCEIDANRQLHLRNEGTVTAVTLLSNSPGQQQQSSNHFTTGQWTAAPALYHLRQGMLIVISAASTYHLQLQGGQIQMLSGALSEQMADQLQQAQPVTLQRDDSAKTVLDAPMQPMQPMQPIRMQNPMSLSMGDMTMTMGKSDAGEMSMGDMKLETQPPNFTEGSSSAAAASASSQGSTDAAKARRFCSQCGSAVAPGDRFCAHCGSQLN